MDHNYHNEQLPVEEGEIITTVEDEYPIRYEIVNVPVNIDGTMMVNGNKYELLQEPYGEEQDQYIEEEYLETRPIIGDQKPTLVEMIQQIKAEGSIIDNKSTTSGTSESGEKIDGPPEPPKKVRSSRIPEFIEPVEITNEETGQKDSGYRCNICNKSFRSAHQIRYHQYCDDSVEKPFKCEHCDVRYRTSYQLKQHQQLHTDIYYECSECGRKFQHDASAKKHWKKHFQKVPPPKKPIPRGTFPCDMCDKIFARKDYLKKHMICHEGYKKYKCAHCDKTYARNNALKFHILTTHTDRQDYPCDCGKTFSTQQSLMRHQVVHSAVKPLKCLICGLKSSRKDNLLRHIRSFHPGANPRDNILLEEHPIESIDEDMLLPDDGEQENEEGNIVLSVSENEIRSKEQHLRKNVIVMKQDVEPEREYTEMSEISENRNNEVYMEVGSIDGTIVVLGIPEDEKTKTIQTMIVKDDSQQVPKHTKKMTSLEIYRKILMPSIEDEAQVSIENEINDDNETA